MAQPRVIQAYRAVGPSVKALLMCLIAVLAVGCGSKKKVFTARDYQRQEKGLMPQDLPPKVAEDTYVISDHDFEKLIAEARTWIGVPYRYGGNDRDGVDCSGFLVQIFRIVEDFKLPRTSVEQYGFCSPVGRDDVAVGDLIFFSSASSGDKVAHVGMYVGRNMMIHASSTRGVTESDITAPYFVKHFVGIGRIPPVNPDFDVTKVKTVPDTPASDTSGSSGTSRVAPKTESPEAEEPRPDSPENIVRNAFSRTKGSERDATGR